MTSASAEVPGRSAPATAVVVELELDLDRAVLLQEVRDVGRHRVDPAREVRAGARVDGDARRLAGLDAPESTSSIGALT